MVGLLGDGDPLVAFSWLQARTLETLELNDDNAAVAFGEEFGYEARQARRYLAQLICSNWVVHAVPSVEVFIAEQSAAHQP